MSVTGMRCPLDDKDIKELAGHSRLQEGNVNRGSTKQGKVLSSRRWRDAVVLARYKLKLPAEGISIEDVRARHDDLLFVLLSQSDHRPEIDKRSVLQFWRRLVQEARVLCHLLSLDPAPLDRLRVAFGANSGNVLMGLGKLVNPELVFKYAGKPIDYLPSQTDRLMGHILWGLSLTPAEVASKPSITYSWEIMPDGGGRHYQQTFNIDQATASELRELQASQRQIKKYIRNGHLRSFSRGGTWKERWKAWNQTFPDLAFPSPGTMRKAKAYLDQTRKAGSKKSDNVNLEQELRE